MLRIALSFIIALVSMPLFAATDAAAQSAVPGTPAANQEPVLIGGESALTRIDRKGTLRVGVAVNVPWVMHDKNGELIGYSIDVARKIASDMGWKLELVSTSWPKLLYDLRTDRYDVVISGLSITPQRARLALFSQRFGEYDIGVIVNRKNVQEADVAALARAGKKRIAARAGTLTVGFARERLPQAEIIEVDDETQAIADLREGKLDGFVAEAPAPRLLETIYPQELRMLGGEPLARTAHGLAVRRDDRDLLDVLDAWIIDADAGGWLKSRSDYWFNGVAWADQL